jgi:hypothetical protein
VDNITTFIVIKDIYDYQDYRAHKLIARTISHFFFIIIANFAIVIGFSTTIIIVAFFYNYIYIYILVESRKKGISSV